MEDVNTTYSDPMFSEELINTIIARGLRHNGRDMVKVESLNNENTGEEEVKKNIMMLVGACLFLIGATIVFPAFFGYQI